MTTALYVFYLRAIPMLAAFVTLILAAVVLSVAAFAQGAAPAAEPERDLIGLVFSSASAAIVSLVAAGLAAVMQYIPAWARGFVDRLTTSEAVDWEHLIDSALDRAEGYARNHYDAVKNRSEYIGAVAAFLNRYNPEIIRWLDKNHDGVVDLLEARLPGPSKPPPAAASEKPRAILRPVEAAAPRRKGEAVQ